MVDVVCDDVLGLAFLQGLLDYLKAVIEFMFYVCLLESSFEDCFLGSSEAWLTEYLHTKIIFEFCLLRVLVLRNIILLLLQTFY